MVDFIKLSPKSCERMWRAKKPGPGNMLRSYQAPKELIDKLKKSKNQFLP